MLSKVISPFESHQSYHSVYVYLMCWRGMIISFTDYVGEY